jgi:hypothetical protein
MTEVNCAVTCIRHEDPLRSHRWTPEDRAALCWLFGCMRPHGQWLGLVVLVALISAGLVLLQPPLTSS